MFQIWILLQDYKIESKKSQSKMGIHYLPYISFQLTQAPYNLFIHLK